jgi:hypothetical protein
VILLTEEGKVFFIQKGSNIKRRQNMKYSMAKKRQHRKTAFFIFIIIALSVVSAYFSKFISENMPVRPTAVMQEEEGPILRFEVTSSNGKTITVLPSNKAKFEELKKGTFDYYYEMPQSMKDAQVEKKQKELLKKEMDKK